MKAILFVFVLALICAALLGHCNRSRPVPQTDTEPAGVIAESRPCVTYPHALVPCGVWSMEEFNKVRLDAATKDPELERAYGEVGHNLTAVVLGHDTMFYANYREGSYILWTPKPVLVNAGEKVLIDGEVSLVRARCGNLLSAVPREPKAFVMPPEMEHETPTVIWPDDAPVLPPDSLASAGRLPVPMVAFLPPEETLPVSPRGPFLPSLIPMIAGASAIPPAVFLGGPPVIVRGPVRVAASPEPGTVWLCFAVFAVIFMVALIRAAIAERKEHRSRERGYCCWFR